MSRLNSPTKPRMARRWLIETDMNVRQVFKGNHLVVLESDGWEFAERRSGKSAVAIVARTDDGQVILTEQMRQPVDAMVIDLPAGLIGDEEGHSDPEETARLELEEETGYTCTSVELLAT